MTHRHPSRRGVIQSRPYTQHLPQYHPFRRGAACCARWCGGGRSKQRPYADKLHAQILADLEGLL